MPSLLEGFSHTDVFHLIGWSLFAFAIISLGCVLGVMLFGDSRQSPLDRCATWMAHQLKGDDGKPLIQPWEAPSPERKLLSTIYFLGLVALMLWFAVSFIHVD